MSPPSVTNGDPLLWAVRRRGLRIAAINQFMYQKCVLESETTRKAYTIWLLLFLIYVLL